MSKFDELKKLAEAATPGPWVLCKYGSVMDDASNGTIVPAETGMQDNAFIAAANPAAILDLLAIQAQLVGALKSIAQWELPETGKDWPSGGKVSYEAEHGTHGARDYIRQVAFDALSAAEEQS